MRKLYYIDEKTKPQISSEIFSEQRINLLHFREAITFSKNSWEKKQNVQFLL